LINVYYNLSIRFYAYSQYILQLTCDGELCILFGSRAKGCAKKGSDVDIAIIGDGAKVMYDPFYHIL